MSARVGGRPVTASHHCTRVDEWNETLGLYITGWRFAQHPCVPPPARLRCGGPRHDWPGPPGRRGRDNVIALPITRVAPGAVMDPQQSFQQIMARLRAGKDAAAANLVGRFSRRLAALARKRFDSRLGRKED